MVQHIILAYILLISLIFPRPYGAWKNTTQLANFPCLLRTVPTIVIAHTVCASRGTRISYGWCLLTQGYFCAVQNYAEKAELSKCSCYPKRKVAVTMHFSEIIKL